MTRRSYQSVSHSSLKTPSPWFEVGWMSAVHPKGRGGGLTAVPLSGAASGDARTEHQCANARGQISQRKTCTHSNRAAPIYGGRACSYPPFWTYLGLRIGLPSDRLLRPGGWCYVQASRLKAPAHVSSKHVTSPGILTVARDEAGRVCSLDRRAHQSGDLWHQLHPAPVIGDELPLQACHVFGAPALL